MCHSTSILFLHGAWRCVVHAASLGVGHPQRRNQPADTDPDRGKRPDLPSPVFRSNAGLPLSKASGRAPCNETIPPVHLLPGGGPGVAAGLGFEAAGCLRERGGPGTACRPVTRCPTGGHHRAGCGDVCAEAGMRSGVPGDPDDPCWSVHRAPGDRPRAQLGGSPPELAPPESVSQSPPRTGPRNST